ncbi:MAG: hypothetical protein KHW75_05815 [[Eubacterium] rectale]|nr:hypothetical protein [Agathobacter rectalis]
MAIEFMPYSASSSTLLISATITSLTSTVSLKVVYCLIDSLPCTASLCLALSLMLELSLVLSLALTLSLVLSEAFSLMLCVVLSLYSVLSLSDKEPASTNELESAADSLIAAITISAPWIELTPPMAIPAAVIPFKILSTFFLFI